MAQPTEVPLSEVQPARETRWMEVVGVVAVVLSLLFVAYEIRQANKLALVANVTAHYASFSDINDALMSDPELTELLARAHASNDASEFSEAEWRRIISYVLLILNTWIPATISYENGQLAEASYEAIFDDARAAIAMSGPAMREIWREAVFTYPSLSELEIIAFLRAELGP